MKKKRVLFLVGAPAPYRELLFEQLAQSSRYEIRVLYCRKRQPDQGWNLTKRNYSAVFLKNLSPARWKGKLLITNLNPGVLKQLRNYQPDAVVVYGYNSLTMLLAVSWCNYHGVPVLMRSDSNIQIERVKPSLHLMAKRMVLAFLVKRITAFLTIGKMNSAYWRYYGALPSQIFPASFAIDTEYFGREAERRRTDRERARSENGWQSMFLLLYVGRLVRVKRVDALIEAVRLALAEGLNVELLIVGDGAERKRLEALASGLAQIHFLGFKDWRSLPQYYGVADLLVLPSEGEQWGLVINEAMASGLPVLAVQSAAAAKELIDHRRNGFLASDGAAPTLASALKQACTSRNDLSALGRRARSASRAWAYSSAVEGIDRALISCLSMGRRS